MHSSISNSDQGHDARASRNASVILIAGALVFFLALEITCRTAVPRISSIERRFENQYHDVVNVQRAARGPRQVMVAGNSLLQAGLDYPEAKKALLPNIDLHELIVLDSVYYDWYFGLRRILHDGARPDVIALVLAPRHLVSSGARDDYFSYHLMRFTDAWQVGHTLGLSNTDLADRVFANWSAFFGLRAEVRNFITEKVFPDLGKLTALMTRQKSAPLNVETLGAETAQRLKDLSAQTNAYGVKLIVVIPPTQGHESTVAAEVVQKAGREAGVAVLIPVAPESVGADLYRDGFHLNERGAALFTPRFAESLREALSAIMVK